jgi:hypothetical protein
MFVLLFLSSFFFQEITEIKLPDEPIKKGVFQLEELHRILPEDGFYTSIDSKFRKDGAFAIFDKGNSEIHVYNKNGKKRQSRFEADQLIITGGYYSDIVHTEILFEKYLVLQTREKNTNILSLDIIDENLNYFTNFRLEEEAEIVRMYFTEDKLALHLKNSDNGPFLKIYNYKI